MWQGVTGSNKTGLELDPPPRFFIPLLLKLLAGLPDFLQFNYKLCHLCMDHYLELSVNWPNYFWLGQQYGKPDVDTQ